MDLARGLDTLLMVAAVAALAPLLVALLPGPRIPQVVILLAGGMLIGPEALGWADRAEIDLLANVGERRSAKSVPRDRRAPRHHPTERQLQPRGSDR